MRTRVIGVFALMSLLLTALWLILLIVTLASAGTFETFEQQVDYLARQGALFYFTYLNATLLTIVVAMLFVGLYLVVRPIHPVWAAMGVVWVPVYALLNLFAYLSQVTIVPGLLAVRGVQDAAMVDVLLRQAVPQWSGSAVWALNNLGYAVLGIPSIIFGALLLYRPGALRWAGVLLALSGIASIVGFGGIIAASATASLGSIAGEVLFLVALIPLSIGFLRWPVVVET